MTTVRTAPAGVAIDTRERILRASLDLFAHRGYASTSVREIARKVGLQPGSLYAHFPSKEAILEEALDGAIGAFLEHVLPVHPSGDPATELVEIVRAHVLYELDPRTPAAAADLLLGPSALRHLSQPAADRLRHQQRRYSDRIRELVAEAAPNGLSPTVVAFAIVSMCDRVRAWFDQNGALGSTEVADACAQAARLMLGDCTTGRARV